MKLIVAFGIIIGVAGLLFAGWFSSAEKPPYTIESASYPTPAARIRALKLHWPSLKSPVLDAVYTLHIAPHGLGPSVCEYAVAVKIDPRDLPAWLVGYQRIEQYAPENDSDLPDVTVPWPHASPPAYYYFAAETLAVYPKEGILVMRGID